MFADGEGDEEDGSETVAVRLRFRCWTGAPSDALLMAPPGSSSSS